MLFATFIFRAGRTDIGSAAAAAVCASAAALVLLAAASATRAGTTDAPPPGADVERGEGAGWLLVPPHVVARAAHSPVGGAWVCTSCSRARGRCGFAR